jgi:RNA polymerase sigma-70 factor (ECF subfamily)
MARSGDDDSPPNRDLSDEVLMLRTGQGDRGAFDEIVRRYSSRMVNVVYQMTGDSELAQDIAQETFYRAYRSASTYKQIAKFSTWLYTIALNLCRNELRRRKHKFYSLEEMAEREEEPGVRIDIEDESAKPDRDVEQKELSELIKMAIDRLPEKFRQPLVLRDVQGLSYEETGEILNLPEGTVKSRINRARQRVKEILRPYLDEAFNEEN